MNFRIALVAALSLAVGSSLDSGRAAAADPIAFKTGYWA